MAAIASSNESWAGHTYAEVEAYIKSEFDGCATAAQGAKADTAYQLPEGGIPSTDLSDAVNTSLGKADTAVQPTDISDMATQTWVGNQSFAKKALVVITGDGLETEFTVQHDLNTTFVMVQVQAAASPYGVVDVTVAVVDEDNVTVTFAEAPDDGASYKVLVIG